MRKAFIDVIRPRLMPRWTSEVALAWNKLFCRITGSMLEGYRQENDCKALLPGIKINPMLISVLPVRITKK
jgi:hypothetical protein